MDESDKKQQFPLVTTAVGHLRSQSTQNGTEMGQEDHLIPAEHQAAVSKATQIIRGCLEGIAHNIFQAGQELATVKQLLGHGHFGEWLKNEFPGCERLAQQWMNVYQRLGDRADLFVKVKPTVLYYLAMPSTPDKVIRLVEQKVKAGEHLTVKGIQEIIAACKDPQMSQTQSSRKGYTASGNQEPVTIRLQQVLLDALKLLGNRSVQECEWVLGKQGGSHLRQIRVNLTMLISLLELSKRSMGRDNHWNEKLR